MSAFIGGTQNSNQKHMTRRMQKSEPTQELRPVLIPLFFLSHRGINLQHALGKIHANLLALYIHALQIRFGKRHIKLLTTSLDDQQRRFARSKLNVHYLSNLLPLV